MKLKTYLYAFLLCYVYHFCCAGYYTAPPELKKALDYGAETKLIFCISDEDGNRVKNASVEASFVLNGHGKDKLALSDSNGFAILKGKCVGEVVYTIKKEGYYNTNGTIDLIDFSKQDQLIQNGKWQPYGKTYSLVLKEKKKPIRLKISRGSNNIVPNTTIGFDLQMGDCVKPYGKGEIADFSFSLQKKELII